MAIILLGKEGFLICCNTILSLSKISGVFGSASHSPYLINSLLGRTPYLEINLPVNQGLNELSFCVREVYGFSSTTFLVVSFSVFTVFVAVLRLPLTVN